MSDTPRTDAMRGFHDLDTAVDAEFSEQLERELNAANNQINRLEKALEFGVGKNRAKELMDGNHIGEATEIVPKTKEIPCPDCYGGHFRPCNICQDSGVLVHQ